MANIYEKLPFLYTFFFYIDIKLGVAFQKMRRAGLMILYQAFNVNASYFVLLHFKANTETQILTTKR